MKNKILYLAFMFIFALVAAIGPVKAAQANDCTMCTNPQTNQPNSNDVDLNAAFQGDVFQNTDPNTIMTFMNQLKNNLTNKSGDDFDKAYIQAMIAIHKMHNDIAQIGVQRANHNELKDLSQQMINDSQRETDMLQSWYSQWFGTQPQQ